MIVLFLAALLTQDRPAEKPSEKEIVALIDRFAEYENSKVKYYELKGGFFAPLTGIEFHRNGSDPPPKRREGTFADLVAAGSAALPHLVARLGDKRETRIKFVHGDPYDGGIFLREEYDRNHRTWKGEEFGRKHEPYDLSDLGERGSAHTVTVGDLCFVALGQVVNRGFDAWRYQPSSCWIANSTSRSDWLRNRVVQEWGKLNEGGHRKSLEADALTPDGEGRRQGALIRLSFYYPDAVDDVAIRVLRLPRIDYVDSYDFVHDILYGEADASKWKDLLEDYVSKHAPSFRDGVLIILLEDAGAGGEKQAKPRLDALFPGAKAIRREDLDSIKTIDLAAAIRVLDRHRSSKVDDAVLNIFRGLKGEVLSKDDSEDCLALACIRRLHQVGTYDAELAEYCRRRIPKAGHYKAKLEEALRKLEKQD